MIGAGGGAGCTYIPRYTTEEKLELKRHKMFTTFMKVHGVGYMAVFLHLSGKAGRQSIL
jgi:hypothetical protein